MPLYKKPIKKKTNKLFYKKWPYKIECFLHGSSYVARLGLQRTLDWANNVDHKDQWIYKNANRLEVKKFAESYALFADEDIQLRVEGSHFNIFLGDKVLYERICKIMERWITSVTEPGSEQELEFLMSEQNKKVICNTIPDGKFHFRIYLKTTKFKPDDRKSFFEWLNRYPGKFKISNTTERYLQGWPCYPQNPCIYVTDRAMTSTVILYLGQRTKKVEEFITRSSINTILCQPLVKI